MKTLALVELLDIARWAILRLVLWAILIVGIIAISLFLLWPEKT